MTFWHSLSEKAKNALIGWGIMIPALVFAGAIGVWTDWTFYDLIGWLLGVG